MSIIQLERYREMEILQAATFAASLKLKKEEVTLIDNWVESLIELNIKKEIGVEQTQNFFEIYNTLQEVSDLLDGRFIKYLLGRLIKIYDSMWGNVFSPIIDSFTWNIKEYRDEAFALIDGFSQIEFTSFLVYLRGAPIDPNSEIFDYIWKIEKQSKFFHSADFFMRNKALKYLLDLNGKRGFHHNIKDFKKIIGFIKPDNTDIIHYLVHYKVNNNQGCYQVIRFIFSDLKNNNYKTFQIKKDCIIWLDNAVGRSPKKPWMNKLTAIQRELKEEELLKIALWILNNGEFEIEQSTEWVDSVYKKFQKSSSWYLDMRNSDI